MKLSPRPWTWPAASLAVGWLNKCPTDRPIVWQAELTDDSAILSPLVSMLSAQERARLERMQQPDDRQRFLVGRGLLRVLTGAQLDLPPERVEFQYGPFGKPSLLPHAGITPFQFNVAHSGKLVLLAFHPAREVGVDVEEERHDVDWEAVARRVFSPSEYNGWTQLKPEERTTAFFRAWTRHEAALKAFGLGGSGESNALPHARLEYFDLQLPARYAGAVCRLH